MDALSKSLCTLIRDECLSQPDKIAISEEGGGLTYSRLWDNIEDLSAFIFNYDLSCSIVAVTVTSSINYVISILSIMNVRGVFAPVDLSWPEPRIIAALDLMSPAAIVVQNSGISLIESILKNDDAEYFIEKINDELCLIVCKGRNSGVNAAQDNWTSDSLYLLSTSGSTGEPNIVEGRHISLLQFISWQISEFNIDSSCRVSLLAPITFDVSLRDIFVPLCAGGTLCIPSKGTRYHPVKFPAWIEKYQINLIHTVPSVFNMATSLVAVTSRSIGSLASIEMIFFSGEALYTSDVNKIRNLLTNESIIVNLYGPTECTLVKSFHRITKVDLSGDNSIVPLGKPISDAEITVQDINEKGHGEIVLKSKYLTKGYYRNRSLTRDKFYDIDGSENTGRRCYRTGDLGYFDDNILHFVGRIDFQIKIAGNRVELGEIEECVRKMPQITNVVALPYKLDKNDKNYKIYCVISSSEYIDDEKLRRHIVDYLPNYMLPEKIIRVSSFPLKPNGKIDRIKLMSMNDGS